MSGTSLSKSISFSPNDSKISSPSSLKSTTCLNSGEVEYSPPMAESVSDCGDEVGLDRVGDVGDGVLIPAADGVGRVGRTKSGVEVKELELAVEFWTVAVSSCSDNLSPGWGSWPISNSVFSILFHT
jgi:hypothetical protein